MTTIHRDDESPQCSDHNFIHRPEWLPSAQIPVLHRIHSTYYDDDKY